MKNLLAPRLLVVSDGLRTGPLLAYSLQIDKFDVIMEADPTRTLRRWAEDAPNLVILDITTEETVSLSIIRNLREESNVPIVMLSSDRSEEYFLEAYDAGVDECILKPISPSMFHAKIKAWLRRSWSIPMDVLDPLRVGSVHLVPADRNVVIAGGPPIHLTNLEMRLLYILMNRASRTVADEELIQRVWGYNGEVDNTVLKNMIYRLRRKIQFGRADPEIIQTVAGLGYKFVSEEHPE